MPSYQINIQSDEIFIEYELSHNSLHNAPAPYISKGWRLVDVHSVIILLRLICY